MNPYIGITDFTDFEQVERMLQTFHAHLAPNSKRILHVGVMMSYRTLNDIETKWAKAFPSKEKISDIFRPIDGETHYYCLHYADYSGMTTFNDLSRAIGYAGPYIDAIQLDMPWPEPGLIANAVHTSRRQIEVILLIGKNEMEQANNNPAEIIQRLKDYSGVIDRVLLDKSMGRGLGMNANDLIPFAVAIRENFPSLGIVVAGGLGPETIHLVEPLVAVIPDISIDAQAKLRPSGNALNPIDWNMAENYLIKALQLLP